MIEWLLEFFEVTTGADLSWLLIGIGAQLLFASRMLVQWIASERQKRSIVPPVSRFTRASPTIWENPSSYWVRALASSFMRAISGSSTVSAKKTH